MSIFIFPNITSEELEDRRSPSKMSVALSKFISRLTKEGIVSLHFLCNLPEDLDKSQAEYRIESCLNSLKLLPDLNIRVHVRGNLELFREGGPSRYYANFIELKKSTEHNYGFDLFLYTNYSYTDDRIRATHKVVRNFKTGGMSLKQFENLTSDFMEEPKNLEVVIATGARESTISFRGVCFTKSPNAKMWLLEKDFSELSDEEIDKLVTKLKLIVGMNQQNPDSIAF